MLQEQDVCCLHTTQQVVIGITARPHSVVVKRLAYTLSHPENDCDVTERVQEYTLQDASFMHQSWCSFLNA